MLNQDVQDVALIEDFRSSLDWLRCIEIKEIVHVQDSKDGEYKIPLFKWNLL